MPEPCPEDFANRYTVTSSGCWDWRGAVSRNGYGRLHNGYAHRQAYEVFVGLIPEGLTIDHLCRNRRCVNPAHLEAVTLAQNILRSDGPSAQRARWTQCPRGHDFTPGNTYITPNGRRQCRACARRRDRLRRPRRSAS